MKELMRRSGLLCLSLLLIALVGCNVSSSSGGGNKPDPVTPITAPPTTPTATSTKTLANSTDWTTYHRDNFRGGFVANAPDPKQLTKAWNVHLDGAVYAEPLVVGGRVLVATEGDSLYALDMKTGQVQWRTNVGTPVPQSTLPCGDIDPLGITGTPVYDPATGLVFAVVEIQGPAHILVGVDVNTGKVRVRRSADIPAMEPSVHQQRAALALWKNMVYVAYGGLDGDCGNYHGTVIASQTNGSGPLLSYQLPTPREGGIWATSGPAIDSNGNIYVAVGNGETTSGNWDYTDSVLKLSPTLKLEDAFAPDQWAQDNAGDQDLGSMGPLLLPGGLVYANGKTGLGYLLHADKLGGVGGQALVKQVCRAFGGAALSGTQIFVPCTDGIRQLLLGSGVNLALGWQAPSNVSSSPIVGGHTVYSLDPNGGTLYALNSDTGAVRATIQVGSASRFASPTLAGNMVFVGTYSGVVAVTIA
jgi:outer membrane protein assembly factor BamB